MSRLPTVAVIVLLCSMGDLAGQSKTSIVISLRRECHLFTRTSDPHRGAATYDVAVGSDGKAVYQGHAGMRTLGSRSYRVRAVDVQALAVEFEKKGFFDLRPIYQGIDLPDGRHEFVDHECSTTLTIATSDGRKTVQAFYGLGTPPSVIEELAKRVDDIAQVERFRQPDSGR